MEGRERLARWEEGDEGKAERGRGMKEKDGKEGDGGGRRKEYTVTAK